MADDGHAQLPGGFVHFGRPTVVSDNESVGSGADSASDYFGSFYGHFQNGTVASASHFNYPIVRRFGFAYRFVGNDAMPQAELVLVPADYFTPPGVE